MLNTGGAYAKSFYRRIGTLPKKIILSGRLMALDFTKDELTQRLNKYAPVVKVKNLSRIAKEAACGAYIIGEGLLGGKYYKIVENMG